MRSVTVAALLLIATTARSEQWLQRYHDAQHTSFINVPVDPMNQETFRYIFDPSEVDVGTSDIFIHYTDPKIEANGDLYVPLRDRQGTTITYSVQQITSGVPGWTFTSDYVRQPTTAWEQVFDFAINNGIVYVMGAYGCVWLLNEADGTLLDYKCATDGVDPTGEPIWDVSPFTIDGNGNVYWTVRSSSALIGASLVKLDPTGNITASDLAALAGTGQIAGNNSAPAVSADNNTIYVATTLTSPLVGQSGGKLLALDATDPTLTTVLWIGNLSAAMGCVESRLNDSGTSSPIALPDGGAAIGGYNTSPNSEGAYYSYDANGNRRGCYPFGWDDTMGQITLNGTTYLVGKHNHYTIRSYELVVLDATTMVKQWSYFAENPGPPHGPYEWCIDSPTLFKTTDDDGTETGYAVVQSESGDLFSITLFSDPPEETHFPVGGPQNAAYVPTVSIGGTAYTINHGQIIGVGNGI
jgi:hypothetical protein